MRITPLILSLLLIAASGSEAIAQYGNSNNSNSRNQNNPNNPSNANNPSNPNGRTRTQPRTKVESTDRESEDADEREARRDAGREDSANKGKTPGLSEGPETVGQVEEANWGKLTPEQQAAAVEELKKFAEEAKVKVNPSLAAHETKYFLFYSDLKPNEAQRWASTLDNMYLQLAKLFAIKGGENIFRGKGLVFVFAREQDYLTFQKEMHKTDATGSAGLCHQYGNGDVHVAFFRQPNDLDFQAVLVHETAHGFLHRYRKPPVIPTWVNEGLCEWIAGELVPQKGKRMELKQHGIGELRNRGGLDKQFFSADHLEGWQYPVSASLADFMIKANRKNYVAFIDGMKDGMKWEEALTTKYGVPLDRLVAAFGEEHKIRGLGQSDPRRAKEPNRDREDEERRQDRE